MYSTKPQVDNHIANILGRIKDENERNSRGYLCAKLYYGIQEYDIAKRYLAGFLNVRDNYAPAHKLMGQIQDGLENPELAITAYKRSLDFDERQRDVIIKICELYIKTGVDPERAKYWAERAEKVWTGHPIIFKLREKMVGKKEGGDDADDLEALITSELVKQPKNPELRAKLLRMYMDTGRINEAYTHGIDVENKDAYPNSLPWCNVLLQVLEAYQKQSGDINGTFHQQLFTIHARLVRLSLETAKVAETAEALYKFDQSLSSLKRDVVSGPVWDAFFQLTQAEYFTYAGHLLLKRAQQDHLSWVDATNMAALCYLASYSVSPPNLQTAWVVKATDEERTRYTEWHDAACARRSEAGHILQSLCGGDGAKWASKIHSQWATQQGRSKMYDSLFTLRHMKGAKDTSFFMNNELVSVFKPTLPTEQQLRELDKVAHLYRPSQLRTLVWLALHGHQAAENMQPDYGFRVFRDLQYETQTALDTASPETLSQLDTQAFLYAVVHTSALRLAERHKRLRMNESQPCLLPLCFGEDLCSVEQAEWWETAYNLNNNKAREELGRLRLILQRGIETVRLIGNHGMPVSLVLHLARVFASRAQDAVSVASVIHEGYLQERAALYWTTAVDMLERLAKNQMVWSPKKRLFKEEGAALTDAQITAGLEEGRLFLAVHAMHSGQQEEAVNMFDKLQSADAAFHQAQIYRSMADDAERPDDGEGSLQVALLTKARDALYLTLDRIRGQRHHKLTPILPTEIDDVESKLNRLISGAAAYPRRGSEDEVVDGLPEPSQSILQAASASYINTSTPQKKSTPYRSTPHRSPPTEQYSHIRPSPEKLDAQMRSLTMSQEILIKQLMDQNEELKKQNKMFTDEISKNRDEIEKLKKKVDITAATAAVAAPMIHSPAMAPGSPGMHPGMRPHMAPPGGASPYYAAYRPHEYDYPGGTPHPPPPPLAAYSPHPHGYPMYAPPPPMPPHYPYPQPMPHQHPPPMPGKQTLPKTAGNSVPAVVGVVTQQEDEEEDYYIYDEDAYDEEAEDPMVGQLPGLVRDQGMAPMPGGPGAFQIPDSQLIQDWPYGNNVNLEGKSTLTYSPTHPLPPQPSYFPQMVAPSPARAPVPAPMYGAPVVQVPAAIGPGFFSSPERPLFAPRFQSPTHIPIPATQGAVVVGLPGQAAALALPKPGFLPATSVQSPAAPSAKIPPPNASLTPGGGVINPPSMPPVSSAAAAAFTGGNIFKVGGDAADTTPTTGFGTQFIMTMPAGTSATLKPPTSLSSVPAFNFGLNDGRNPSFIDNPEEEEDDNLAGEDAYQGPDFEPIIPLPDEVEVVTGEEEETILFAARTKLFRFTEKQWKERGLGEIKILHHTGSGRVRVVMRREQVHKVCANHSLSPEMTIDFKSPTEKKVVAWQAMDFAEGDTQMEKLCAKFKSEEIALEFKEKFEEGVKLSSQKKIEPTPAKAEDAAPKAGLFDKFKPKAGTWACDTCMVNNTADLKKCVACTTPKPGATPEKDDGAKVTMAAGGGFNFGSSGAAASSGGFTFGTPSSSSGFAFGSSGGAGASASTSTPSKPVFGTPGSSGFSFGNTGDAADKKSEAAPFMFPASTPGKPSIVIGSSGTVAGTPSTAPKATPAISPPKFSFVSSTSTTSTTATAAKPVFSFGNTPTQVSSSPAASTFKFGESKLAEAAAGPTPAADMLKAFANKSKPSDTPNPKASTEIGGFTFTSAPVVADKKEVKPKEEPKKPEETTKASPFAGFSFGKTASSSSSTPVFGASTTFGSTSSTPTFGSLSTPKEVQSTPNTEKDKAASGVTIKPFGGISSDAAPTFDSLGTAKPDAFSKKTEFKGFSGAGQQLFVPKSPQTPSGDGGADEDYEPDVDFQPLIPLPDLIAVETGEENEEKLFSERVKLFRNDHETKQWKERGIGEIKILKHKETNRCRLVMRREQVLKICCNQIITPDIKLQKMATSDKAWCWVAQDFSEGDMKIEQFACRFKSIDSAANFKEVYECAQQIKVTGTPEKKKPEDKGTATSDKSSLKDVLKPKVGEWECQGCYVRCSDPVKCPACQTPKPGAAPAPSEPQVSSSSSGFKFGSGMPKATTGGSMLKDMLKGAAGEWECQACYVKSADPTKCPSCQTPKPGAAPATSLPQVSTSSSGFKFGSKPAATTGGSMLKDMLKGAAGEWECQACYVKSADPTKCPSCQTPKPGAAPATSLPQVSTSSSGFKFGSKPAATTGGSMLKDMLKGAAGEWECQACYVKSADPTKCPSCQTPKPGAAPAISEPQVSSSSSGFKFGSKPAATTGGSMLKDMLKGTAEEKKPTTATKGQGSLKDLLKGQEGEWQCEICYVKSTALSACPACETPRPGAAPAPKPEVSLPASGFKFGSGGGFKFGSTPADSSADKGKTSESAKPPSSLMELLTSTEEAAKPAEVTSTSTTGFGSFKFNAKESFTFGKTSDSNEATSTVTTPAKPFSFTPSSSTTGAVFGQAASTNTTEKKDSSPFTFTPSKPAEVSSSTGSGFVFGIDNANSSFNFGGVTPSKPLDLSASRSPRSPGAGEDFYVNQEGDDSHIYFEPIVQLEKVEVKTGEEDEEVLFCRRAKCFRFDDVEWKERGLGEVKILMHQETKKRRIIMRREQVHKLCLNHYITPDLELVPMNNAAGKAWVWHADDFVENEIHHEKLAIRFKSKEFADEFQVAFTEAQEVMADLVTPTKDTSGKTEKDSTKTVKDSPKTVKDTVKQSLADKFDEQTPKDAVQSGEISSTADKTDEPKSLFGGTSSASSFSFKSPSTTQDSGKVFGASPAFGATPVFGGTPAFGTAQGFSFGKVGMSPTSIFGGAVSSSESSAESGVSPLNKGKQSILTTMLTKPTQQAAAPSDDNDDIQIISEKRATPEQIERARKLQLPDHFYLYEEREPCPGCLGCDDGEGKMIKPKDKNDDVIYVGEDTPTPEQLARANDLQLPANFYMYENKPACQGCAGCEKGTPGPKKCTPTETQDDEPSSTTSEAPMFTTNKDTFSFSSVAAASSGFGFGQKKEAEKPFSWQGAGATLFGSPSGRTGGDEDEDGVPQSDDIHFEPLVSLPEIEVRTGEEDEDVLYSHRSKLFRFDNKLNQWKERGVGEIKLLKHRETEKIRVLMRRDQVLKIACNHALTTDMKLTPLQTSETAWCWFALDIAEGEPRREHLAIKFKTREIAEVFREKFEECQAMLAASPAGGDIEANSPSCKVEPTTPSRGESFSESDVASPGSGHDTTDDYTEEYDEEEDEDLRPWFAKRATMMYANGENWKTEGMGELEVTYDDDVNGARVTMATDGGELICNHIICREYSVQCNEAKKFCEWTAKDFSTDDPVKRTFRVQFSSKVSVREFSKIFEQGRDLAVDSEIWEAPDHGVGGRELTLS